MRQWLLLFGLFVSAASSAMAQPQACEARDAVEIEFAAIGKTVLLKSHLYTSADHGVFPVVDRELSISNGPPITLPTGRKIIDEADVSCSELLAESQVAITDSLRSGGTIDNLPDSFQSVLLQPSLCEPDRDNRCHYADTGIFLEGTNPALIAELMTAHAPIIRIKESAYILSVWAFNAEINKLIPLWVEGC